MNRDLFLAILAMDSYNRGYGAGIKGLPESGSVGTATLGKTSADLEDAQGNRIDIPAGFYAVAYNWAGETVISYRGTDFDPGETSFTNPFAFFNSPLWRDAGNGWGAGIGSSFEPQAKLAFEFYNSVAGQLGATDPRLANISTTGHSLGGGLAGVVSASAKYSQVANDNVALECAA